MARRRGLDGFWAWLHERGWELPIALLLLGIVASGIALLLLRSALETRSWPTAIGTVVEVDQNSTSKGDVSYDWTVEFTARDSNANDHLLAFTTNRGEEAKIGDTIEVSYNPDNVERFVTRQNRYFRVGLAVFAAVAAFASALYFGSGLLLSRRQAATTSVDRVGTRAVSGVNRLLGKLNFITRGMNRLTGQSAATKDDV